MSWGGPAELTESAEEPCRGTLTRERLHMEKGAVGPRMLTACAAERLQLAAPALGRRPLATVTGGALREVQSRDRLLLASMEGRALQATERLLPPGHSRLLPAGSCRLRAGSREKELEVAGRLEEALPGAQPTDTVQPGLAELLKKAGGRAQE
jgi:hypothetical protein